VQVTLFIHGREHAEIDVLHHFSNCL
jgi:hypothetical protein